MATVVDALGREVSLKGEPRRVVSLVPSETLSVFELAGAERLVGVTDYCIRPEKGIEHVARVGGTKGLRVEQVLDLQPDLVLANKEENSEKLVRRLIDAGLPVHVSFPCTLEESLQYLENLAALLGVARGHDALADVRAALAEASPADSPAVRRRRVFVPIWRDPWMTFGSGTFADDLLARCGADNVFADRVRRYPLAADLGRREAWSEAQVGERDTRYPRVTVEEIAERQPEIVLLPDEPYEFTEADARQLRGDRFAGAEHVSLVDGKDLFWYGTYVAGALPRVRRLLADL